MAKELIADSNYKTWIKSLKENIAVLKDNLVVDRLNAIEWTVLGVLLLLITLTLY